MQATLEEIEQAGEDGARRMTITRGRDAVPHGQHLQREAQGNPDFVLHPAIARGLSQMRDPEGQGGATALTLFANPNMHVSWVWFRSGYPLPLHSHDADCYYLVIGGSMRVGTETLEKGDGVFIPGGTPYTVVPEHAGVEFLEIRESPDYDTHYRAKSDTYWDRVAATRRERSPAWQTEKVPYGLVPCDPEALMAKYKAMMPGGGA